MDAPTKLIAGLALWAALSAGCRQVGAADRDDGRTAAAVAEQSATDGPSTVPPGTLDSRAALATDDATTVDVDRTIAAISDAVAREAPPSLAAARPQELTPALRARISTEQRNGDGAGLYQNGNRILVGDFGGDGKDDLLVIASTGVWWVGLSNGTRLDWTPWFKEPAWGPLADPASGAKFFVGDFGGDRKADVLMTFPNGTWTVGVSVGTQFNPRNFATVAGWGPVLANGSGARLYVGNFAGDHYDDFLFTWPDGTWWVGVNRDLAFHFQVFYSAPAWAVIADGRSAARTFVGDISGTGYDDFLFLWTDGSMWVGESNGATFTFRAFASKPDWGPIFDASSAARTFLVDFDGDQKQDLLFTWPDGSWWAALSGTDRFTLVPVYSNVPWGPIVQRGSSARTYVANFSHPWHDDYLFTMADGTWEDLVSDGTAAASAERWLYRPDLGGVIDARSPHGSLIGDLDGNGLSDFLLTASDGKFWVVASTGRAFRDFALLSTKTDWSYAGTLPTPAGIPTLPIPQPMVTWYSHRHGETELQLRLDANLDDATTYGQLYEGLRQFFRDAATDPLFQQSGDGSSSQPATLDSRVVVASVTATPAAPTATPRPSASPTATPRPSASPTATPRPSASPTPTPTPTPTPSPTATPPLKCCLCEFFSSRPPVNCAARTRAQCTALEATSEGNCQWLNGSCKNVFEDHCTNWLSHQNPACDRGLIRSVDSRDPLPASWDQCTSINYKHTGHGVGPGEYCGKVKVCMRLKNVTSIQADSQGCWTFSDDYYPSPPDNPASAINALINSVRHNQRLCVSGNQACGRVDDPNFNGLRITFQIQGADRTCTETLPTCAASIGKACHNNELGFTSKCREANGAIGILTCRPPGIIGKSTWQR
jgi:hypothetical protein